VCDGGDAVDRAGSSERPERVQPLARQRDPLDQGDHQRSAGEPDRKPYDHLDCEFLDDDPERAVFMSGELEQPDHERDSHGVVGPRLAFENRPGPSSNLPIPEHRKHHRRIRRGESRTKDARARPAEAEQVVRHNRNHTGGGERPDRSEECDGHCGSAEPPPPDVHAAVEQDHDQRDDTDPFDIADRENVAERLEENRDEKKQGRRRERKALRDLGEEDRDEEAERDDEYDCAEVADLAHGEGL
jgi:hypothetical protein